MARDVVADHSRSPHVAWTVIVCCVSHFLCHPETLNLFYYIGHQFPRLTYNDNTDTVEDAACTGIQKTFASTHMLGFLRLLLLCAVQWFS